MPPALLTLPQHIRADGNDYVRRELPGVDFISRCDVVEAPDGQCGRRVAAPAAVALALSVVSLYRLDIEGSGSRTLLCL